MVIIDGHDLAVGPDDRPDVAEVAAAAVVAQRRRRRPRSCPRSLLSRARMPNGRARTAIDQAEPAVGQTGRRLGGLPSPVSGSGVDRNDQVWPSSCEA